MDKDIKSYIYILTNPSFPDYVKIGYADDVNERLKKLNRSECIPFAFRVYATYGVHDRLDDLKLHNMIDRLNPKLRAIDEFDGKKRKREFYEMSPEDAYAILETIAEINGLSENLHRIRPTNDQIKDEQKAIEVQKLGRNRHHFSELTFKSSLTDHIYHGDVNEEGTLRIIDVTSNAEVESNSTPSKSKIVMQALLDVSPNEDTSINLYQAYHRLCNILLKGEEVTITSPVNKNNDGIKVFIDKKYAHAEGIVNGDKVIVLAGSTIRANPAKCFSDGNKAKVKKLIDTGYLSNFTFIKDSEAISLSTASSIILGGSSNGWDDWKVESGESLKSYLKK